MLLTFNRICYHLEMDFETYKSDIAKLATKYGLDFVVLFGSQAIGKTHSKSDVDIGYIASANFELSHLYNLEQDFKHLFQRPDVELVNLNRISPLMKKIVSDHGKIMYQRIPGLFLSYRIQAQRSYRETTRLRELRYQSLKRFVYQHA